MTEQGSLILGMLLAASLAVNGHACQKAGEAEAREKARDALIAELEKEPAWIGTIMTEFEHERANIDDVRKAVREGVRDELRTNPVFKAWADSALPAVVASGGGLLGQTRSGGGPADAPTTAYDGAAAPAVDGNNKR